MPFCSFEWDFVFNIPDKNILFRIFVSKKGKQISDENMKKHP